MLKALFKKQLLQMNAWLFQDKKTGKKRKKASMIGYALLYLYVILVFAGLFFYMSSTLCAPLVDAGAGWLYITIMGLMAVVMGVFVSVFNTYSSLYLAKDNALLLAMPVSPSAILAVGLFGVWFWGIIYEALVLVPAFIVYWTTAAPGALTIVFDILLIVLLSVFVVVLSCVLGWFVAKITEKSKHKSLMTVVASLAFIGAYYYIYFRSYQMLQVLLANAQEVSVKVKGAAYPLYLLGRAGEGDILSMLLLAAGILVLFVLVWWVLSRSFLKMATSSKGQAKQKYKKRMAKRRSIGGALLFKEASRFVSSPTYLLNCGLGTLLLVIVAVLALIKAAWMRGMLLELNELAPYVSLIACISICTLTTMNDITAPSVSLEGKNLWVVRSLPVTAWQALKAKLNLHLLVTELPTFLCVVCVSIALRMDLLSALLIALVCMLFVLLMAELGLVINLKMPNLTWTDEVAAVKQSLGVMLALFGGWGVLMVFVGLYLAVGRFMSANVFLLFCVVLLSAVSTGLFVWLKKRGTEIFASI